MPQNLLFVLIGLGAGVLAGLFGIAGGIVIIPSLVFLAGYSQRVASGTSLAVLVLPASLLGAYAYYKEGNVRIGPALVMAAGLFVGSYVGARISQHLSIAVLRKGFAVLLVVTAARMWFTK